MKIQQTIETEVRSPANDIEYYFCNSLWRENRQLFAGYNELQK